jgi:hypothetical protein
MRSLSRIDVLVIDWIIHILYLAYVYWDVAAGNKSEAM